MTDSAFVTPEWRFGNELSSASRAVLTIADVTSNIRKSTGPRVGFALIMAGLSTVVLAPLYAAAWLAFIMVWEIWLRPLLEDTIVAQVAARSQQNGFYLLSAIHFIGGSVYSFYPLAVWATGAPVGMVLATAWICGSANHLFVYFTPNRLLLASCLIPLSAAAVAAPFTTEGVSLTTAVAVATLASLILAAGLFGFDRKVLLGNLAKQASARAAAEDANAAKSQFLATMSHELRTPLNAVIGYAELIEEEAGGGSISEDANKIRASARQLLGVIDTILDLSKLESGSIDLECERMQSSGVLEQLREAALPLAAANGNTLTVSEATPLGEAELDHRRLHQALLQLVSNAAKFTRNGAITVTASRRVEGGRARLIFDVADTGIGIPAEQVAHIFEPFAQVEHDAARRFEGTGLGLTLVRRLARLMGGDVSCRSESGIGSTFTLWIDASPGS